MFSTDSSWRSSFEISNLISLPLSYFISYKVRNEAIGLVLLYLFQFYAPLNLRTGILETAQDQLIPEVRAQASLQLKQLTRKGEIFFIRHLSPLPTTGLWGHGVFNAAQPYY